MIKANSYLRIIRKGEEMMSLPATSYIIFDVHNTGVLAIKL